MGFFNLRESIVTRIEKGERREVLFSRLVAREPKNAERIAFAIASVPQRDLRRSYLRLNTVLIVLLFGVALCALLYEVRLGFRLSTLFDSLRIALPLVFSYYVYHFHGGIYRLLAAWCLLNLLEWSFLVNYGTIAGLLHLLLLLTAAVVSLVIARRVFPHLRFFGPKADDRGRYLL